MLKAIRIKTEEDERIGRPVVLSHNGKRGWIESIFLYDDTERWHVVGDEIDTITESSGFEFISGQRRDFRIRDGEASSAMRRVLPKEEILRLLLEALDLKKKYVAGGERDRAIYRLIYAIESYLSNDVISWACTSDINRAYIDLLAVYEKEDQWVKKAQQIAGKIVALRNRDKREQGRRVK